MIAKPEYEVAYADLCALVDKHAPKMTSLELLAVAGNMVGKLVALQDQRTVDVQTAMEVVARNMEIGNRQCIDALRNAPTAGSA